LQLFEDLVIISFVGLIGLNWTGYVNIMDTTRKVSQIINNIPQGR